MERHAAGFVQGMRRREGRVAAKFNFFGGSKPVQDVKLQAMNVVCIPRYSLRKQNSPSQSVRVWLAGDQGHEGSLGQVVFHGDILHPEVVTVLKDHSCRISAERNFGKGIHLNLFHSAKIKQV